MFYGYELLGDSNMLRFALQHGENVIGFDRFKTKQLGLCKSGLTIEELLQLVKEQRENLSPKVAVLIGTNDILKCSSDIAMRSDFNKVRGFLDRLRTILKTHCEEVVFLTVPPIPRREEQCQEKYFTRQKALNRNILSCTGPKVRALALHAELEDSLGNATASLFEKTMGKGRSERPDGIHLNKEGLQVLADFLKREL
ncbi:hypothetical protein ONE63_011353 [Megalurothrips usitatus]|uniref:OSK domain-containing protein n=1 Tax=Megalurothrips usitatus TaxID=439358 RepID=A0AAV7X3U6_9NEOP|nr:hypothetical protein ONE63_011353 [Megalurothrips usitatus]